MPIRKKGLPDNPLKSKRSAADRALPYRVLIIVTASVFVAEIFVHLLILYLHPNSTINQSIIDGLITILFVFPFIYYFSFRSIAEQIRKRQRAEKDLMKSQVYYQTIVEDQTDLICRYRPEGNITFANQAFRSLVGRDQAEIEDSFYDLFYSQGRQHIEAAVSQLTPQSPVFTYELPLNVTGSGVLWVLWTVRAIFDSENCLVEFQAVGRDVTRQHQTVDALQKFSEKMEERVKERTAELALTNETLLQEIESRQRTEDILLEREARLQLFLSQSPALLWSTDAKLNITSLQGLDLASLNLRPETDTGKNLLEALSLAEHDVAAEAHSNALQGQEGFYTTHKDGKYYENFVRPFRNSQGEIIGCIGLAMDVTKYREAVEKIEVQAAALEKAASGIIITDARGIIQWANPAFYAMSGFSAIDVVGKSPSIWKSGMHPKSFYREIRSTILSGKVWSGEIINRRKDGSLFTEEQTITPVTDTAGKIKHFVAIKQDITRRKQAEADIQRRNYELSAINTIISKVNNTLDLSDIYSTLFQVISEDLGVPGGAIFACHDPVDRPRLMAHWGVTNEVLEQVKRSMFPCCKNGKGECQREVLQVRSLTGWDSRNHESSIAGWDHCLAVPLVSQERGQGTIVLFSRSMLGFTRNEIQLFEALAAQVGIALQKAGLFEEVEIGRQRLQALSRRLVEIQENERRYVARELHDEASQAITYLIFAINLIKQDINDPESVVKGLAELEEMIHTVLKNLHRLAVNLRPASLDLLGLIPALRQYTSGIEEKHGLLVGLSVNEVNDRLPNEMETSIYRIAQEAVANAVRHAHPARIDVSLKKIPERILMTIHDDGVGFDPSTVNWNDHLGIFGMRERAEMLGGKLTVTSAVGAGTTVQLEVPVDDSSAHL